MSVTLALDTCVISDREFMRWAKSEAAVKLVVPSVVYMERRRQILNNGKDPEILEEILKKCRISVTQLDKNVACQASEYMYKQPKACPECGKLDWVDAIIMASIESPQALLVTKNIKDFYQFGKPERIITPEAAVDRFTQWS